MEIIIGREEGVRRLHCVADGREFNVGLAGCVPTSVSRKHCKIRINGSAMIIENLKPDNITFVDGNQIFAKEITASSNVQLGSEKYTVPLQQVLQLATGQASAMGAKATPKKEPPTFSLRPLENVWEQYNSKLLELQDKQQKNGLLVRLPMIITACGSVLAVFTGPLGISVSIISASVMIYGFWKQKNFKFYEEKQKIDTWLQNNYSCPNPECHHYLGMQPYNVIRQNKKCSYCGCKFTID